MTDDPLQEIRRGLSELMGSVARIDERTKILAEKVEDLATNEKVDALERRVSRHDTVVSRVSWAAVAMVGTVIANVAGLKPPHF